MPSRSLKARLRSLPAVERVLRAARAEEWTRLMPRERVVTLVREAVDEVRRDVLDGRLAGADLPCAVESRVSAKVARLTEATLRPVINASGVILHTNLGRAPLGVAAVRAISSVAEGYCNLEYDVVAGRRGRRDDHCGSLLESLLGAPSIVVNNNAAAVFLVLHALARGGEVLVSRGELVEIGDGFRIQEILEASQARVREVGSTNRTKAEDYSRAICPRTRMLLRIHPSNFRQVGFTGRPTLPELVTVAKGAGLPLVEDLGSGCLSDGPWPGIEGEPPVADSLDAGVDLVTCSGDKLLGGPQAGIIAGRPELVARIRRNPLFRALRVDKLTLAGLGETLRSYLRGREEDVPALRMARMDLGALTDRSRRVAALLSEGGVLYAGVVPGESLLGGGSTPMQRIPSVRVAVSGKGALLGASALERRLRQGTPPVIARIEGRRLVLDLRTVSEPQEAELVSALLKAARPAVDD